MTEKCTPKLRKVADDQINRIFSQIKDIETMIIENDREIKQFQEANQTLRKTLELLKERRRFLLGIAEKVQPLTFSDKHHINYRKEVESS